MAVQHRHEYRVFLWHQFQRLQIEAYRLRKLFIFHIDTSPIEICLRQPFLLSASFVIVYRYLYQRIVLQQHTTLVSGLRQQQRIQGAFFSPQLAGIRYLFQHQQSTVGIAPHHGICCHEHGTCRSDFLLARLAQHRSY